MDASRSATLVGAAEHDLDKDPRVTRFAELVRKHFDTNAILLFGSRARGDHLTDSDYDFIIVSPDFSGMPYLDRIKQVFLRTRSTLAADILCYTAEEFERKKKRKSEPSGPLPMTPSKFEAESDEGCARRRDNWGNSPSRLSVNALDVAHDPHHAMG